MKKVLLTFCAAFVAIVSQAQLSQVVFEEVASSATVAQPDAAGYPAADATTYRIYAEIGATDRVTAVFAEGGFDLEFGTDNGAMWNSGFGAVTGDAINPAFVAAFPGLEWDTFVTIGRSPTFPTDGLSGGVTAVAALPVGVAYENHVGLVPSTTNLFLEDGTWFTTPDQSAAAPQGPNNRVLLGQITTTGGADLQFSINVQVLVGGVGGDARKYVWNEANISEADEFSARCDGLVYPEPADCSGVSGCTDNTACNYDPAATADDGSCELPGDACDDGDATTINDVLQGDCSCAGVTVPGCTDNTACNFDAAATVDDGSCEFPGDACDDGDATTINDVLQGDCSCAGVAIVNGCTDNTACNFDAAANTDDGSCEFPGDACDDGDATTANDVLQGDCSCAGVTVPGCTDNTACNYDATATVDDGSCELPGDACDDGDANTINDVLQGDCSCAGVAIVNGCTDNTACNFDAAANTDDGSCEFPGDACDDGDATTINDVLQGDCSCAGGTVPGCTDNTACNYDAAATVDDGSCELPGDACDDGDANTINDVLQGDCSCAGVAIVNGCTDNTACNYDAAANTDDGSCEFPGDACDDGDATTFNDTLQGDCSCAGTLTVDGCTDNTACNYDATANNDDGSCAFPGDACDDGDATTVMDTYQGDCSCAGMTVPGCIDNTACNFDATATVDDGSCEFPGDACDDGDATTINDVLQGDCSCAGATIVNGCTDNTACNYDATANTDDGSCEFPGDACDDGDATTINDVLQGDCSCAGVTVPGCTDNTACNYDAAATVDDGSCDFSCYGCTDNTACNFDAAATIDDGNCAFPGDACDDGDANTINDIYDGACGCSGTVVGGGGGVPLALNPLGTCVTTAADNSGGDVTFNVTPPTSGIRIEVGTTAFDAIIVVLDDGNNVVTTADLNGGDGDEILNFGALTAGSDYQIVISSSNANSGAFNICGQFLPDTRADFGPGPYDLCDIYKADWVGADSYRFRFTPVGGGDESVGFKMNGNTLFQLRNAAPSLLYNTSYDAFIDAGFDLSTADGGSQTVYVMADEVNSCIIGSQPLSQVKSQYASINGARFIGDYIQAGPFVCGVTDWEWEFTRTDITEPGAYTYFRGSANSYARLSSVEGLMPGGTYDVRVRPVFDGTAGTFGATVEVQIIGMAPGSAGEGPAVEEIDTVERVASVVSAAIYPNPNNGSVLNVNLNNVENSKVTIDIVNMTGAIAQAIELNVANGSVNEVINLNGLASGVYIVNIVANDTVMTERLVIEK